MSPQNWSSPLARSSVRASAADRRGLVFIAAYCAAFFLWLAFDRSAPATKLLVGDFVGPGTAVIALVWSLWGARSISRQARPRGRGEWRRAWSPNLVSLGIASYAAADGIWCYYEQVLHLDPFPSLADVGYVAAVVLLIGGMLLSPRRSVPTALRMRVLLDGLVTMAAIVTFSWFFILGPTVLEAEGTTLAKSLSTAYPLLDLAALFCVVILTANPQERTIAGARRLLCWGMIAFVLGDVTFAYVSLKSSYETGVIDVFWVAANLLLGQGAHRLRRTTSLASGEGVDSNVNPVLWRSLFPYTLVPAVGCLLFYVWRTKTQGPLDDGVYVGSAVLMSLVLIRQVFALVENSRLYRYLQEANHELQALATTDGMTGLPNHRTFQEQLRRELAQAEETEAPVSLLLIDVDRFKSYNDRFGHPAGDNALRIVARVLWENLRTGDMPARYGGEEFAALLPATSEAEAQIVAERVRAACEAETFPGGAVTLSVGLTTSRGGNAGTEIERADRALYAAKNAGRNRVATFGAPLLHVGSSLPGALEAAA